MAVLTAIPVGGQLAFRAESEAVDCSFSDCPDTLQVHIPPKNKLGKSLLFKKSKCFIHDRCTNLYFKWKKASKES